MQVHNLYPRTQAIIAKSVTVFALVAYTGGEWIVLDNLATRKGSQHAMERMMLRNRDTVGPLACVPVGMLAKLPVPEGGQERFERRSSA